MIEAPDLPQDLAAAHAMILAEREARLAVERVQAGERLLIEKLRLEIARLHRQAFGTSSERGRKLEQLELMLEDAEETLAAAEIAAQVAVAAVDPSRNEARERRRPMRGPLPEHLPRERVVVPGPSVCPCCGGDRLSKLGEDVTETLERIPARWLIVQHGRERFPCRALTPRALSALLGASDPRRMGAIPRRRGGEATRGNVERIASGSLRLHTGA